VSEIPPGQQPQYPQQQPQNPQNNSGQQPQHPQGYPSQQGYPQGQWPQQYPMPYSPYQMPQVHPMAYAQAQSLGWQSSRAGMMLIVTGSLMALCGLGCGALAMGPLEQAIAQAPMDPQLAAMMTPKMIKAAFFAFAAGSVLYAVLAIIFGIMVRRQSRGGTIAGIVLSGLVIAYLLLNMLMGLVQMGAGPQAIMGECVMIVPLVVFVWQLMWLIRALRTAGPMGAMAGQMQQMQYWQMMQMQQAQQQQYQQYQQMIAGQQGQGTPPQAQQNSEVRIQNSEEKKEGEGAGGGQV
jgi:hypothetical protein